MAYLSIRTSWLWKFIRWVVEDWNVWQDYSSFVNEIKDDKMVYITCASFELRSLNQKCIRRHQSTRPCHVMSQKDYSGEENIWGKNGENVFDKDQTLYYGIHCQKWMKKFFGVTEAGIWIFTLKIWYFPHIFEFCHSV